MYFAKRAFSETRILVHCFWKMRDFGESYKKKRGGNQRTTCGTGECGAGLPDPPRAAAATAGAAAGAVVGAGVEGVTSAPLSPNAAQFDCTCVRTWFFFAIAS